MYAVCIVHFLFNGMQTDRIMTGDVLSNSSGILIVDFSNAADFIGLKDQDYSKYVATADDCITTKTKGLIKK